MTNLDDSELLYQQAWPTGGRMCTRALADGQALVGVLGLPADFVPEEGRAYLLLQHPSQISIAKTPVDEGIPNDHQSCMSVGDLMCAPIWPKTTHASAKVVRFFQAFPEQNRWTVFGVSNHSEPDAPNHRWVDIGQRGQVSEIAEPFNACGAAIGQLLSMHPVWPDAEGALHSLPQLASTWRKHYHRYHQILAEAARDEGMSARLEKTLAADPYLRDLSMGRIDRQYCQFLALLEDRGLLKMDAPKTAAEHAAHDAACDAVIRETSEPAPVRRRPGV